MWNFPIYIIIAQLTWWAFSSAQYRHNSVLEMYPDFGCVCRFAYPLEIFAYCFVCKCLVMLVCYVWTSGSVADVLHQLMGIHTKSKYHSRVTVGLGRGLRSPSGPLVMHVAWKITVQWELQRSQHPAWWDDSAGFGPVLCIDLLMQQSLCLKWEFASDLSQLSSGKNNLKQSDTFL